MPGLSPDQMQKIQEFIKAEQLIYAIKLYREATGVGLAEAKKAVEAMARGESVEIPAPAIAGTQLNDPSVETRIKEMLAKRNKIGAVKLYREMYNIGLKEAKDSVDQIEASMRSERSSMITSIPSEPVISNDPFADDSAGNRVRLLITIFLLLLALGGAVAFFLARGFGF